MKPSRVQGGTAQRHRTSPSVGLSLESLALTLRSRSDTEALGRCLGEASEGGEVLALIGELGAGKTALVKGLAAGLRIPSTAVSSPTFVLIHEYQGRLPLIHMDLYRLQSETDAAAIGLEEYFSRHAVCAIEWADRLPALLPRDRLDVRLTHHRPTVRIARLSAHGRRAEALLARVKQSWRIHRGSRGVSGQRRKAIPR